MPIDWRGLLERLHRTEGQDEPKGFGGLLARRAELLARPLETTERTGASETVVVFRVGSDRFALRISDLVEVVRDVRLAKIPRAPVEVAGLIQIRGEICPVYHLAVLLGISKQPSDDPEFALIVRHDNGDFGVAVDEVEDIRITPEAARMPAPPGRAPAIWATEDLIPVLATSSLLQREE